MSSHQNRKEKTWPAWHIHHHVCPKFVEISTHLEWFYFFFLPSRCGAVHVFLQSAVFPMTCHHNTVCALCFLLHFRSKLSWLMVFVRIRVRRLTYLHWNARKKTSINSDWLPSCFGMNALHPAVFPPKPISQEYVQRRSQTCASVASNACQQVRETVLA